MSTVKLRSGRVIGDYLAPYFIAELNTSHFGDIGIARSMIDQAKEAGCDCVKFQSWSSESLYADSYYKQNAITKRIVTKFSLDNSELKQLADYCSEVGIDFASTPYSRAEADFLARDCNVPFIKIASMELNNLPYLAYLATLDVPLVLSTGMGTLDEIITAVRTIETAGNTDIIILHCTSVYPAPPEAIRLNNILGLRAEFPAYPIGYSDHSMGSEIPAASIALGACVIEKHFTLDSSRIGMDNQMATEPEDMKRMIDACNTVHRALGGAGRILDETERAQIPKMRRSIVTAKALPAGHMLTSYDLDAKRPGIGLAPDKVDLLIGRRLKKSVDQGDVLSVDDVE
ncbi:N-acetylneuraminate synthase family protein [Agrobacterium sp. ES01]|uniref:N-acetylneuraminate synthase family protein n=1 Tax=Agrobacterium sp. ES01 TaxID=3420714 RepID=UPI003D0EB8AD